MANSYYHAFVPGFNWWYLVAPVLIIASFLLGRRQYYLSHNLRLMRRFGAGMFTVVSAVSGVIFGAMLFAESMDGIVQWFDNGLAYNDSPVWSLIFAAFGVVVLVVIYAFVVYAVGYLAGEYKRDALLRKKCAIKARRRKNAERIRNVQNSQNIQGARAGW